MLISPVCIVRGVFCFCLFCFPKKVIFVSLFLFCGCVASTQVCDKKSDACGIVAVVHCRSSHCVIKCSVGNRLSSTPCSGAGIMEADDRQVTSLHSPIIIPPSAVDKPSIMKHYHRWQMCSHTSPQRSPMMVTLHDTRFVECRWWNDSWTVKTVVT